ncbi:RagB/SusD family nutrient uptake outer membrane protein [Alistipes communis]|nr:RagB/SusD family nutrient uptake outer membrane protein [Alistipes communis]MCB6996445.1 RagB/SusD family nutrient uptake outer membrane protein [Alistipes communis]
MAQMRVFNPNRDYLWPIPVGEMNTNTAMEQNPGY